MRIALCLTAVVLIAPAALAQKRVVCIDIKKDAQGEETEDDFLSNHEGYERARAGQNDVITRGGTLTDCLMNVANGHTLVIVCHGQTVNGNDGAAFEWCGQNYSDFGNGAGEMPVPGGFGNLENVTVEFCACWSANDPDGAGNDKSLTDKILEAMGDDPSNSATGFVGEAEIGPSLCYDYPANVTTEQQELDYDDLIDACLAADSSWADKAPVNRSNPPPNPNQQSCIQQILNTCPTLANQRPRNVALKYDQPPTDAGGGGRHRAGGTFSCGLTTIHLVGGAAAGVPALSAPALAMLGLLLLGGGALVVRRRLG